MTDDPRTPLMQELDALGVWTPHRPPEDFSDRVLSRAAPRPRRRVLWPVAVAALVLATALGWWFARIPPREGVLTATERETLTLSEDTVVVAEPGTTLRWTERAGALVVEQANGAAFYRVGHGAVPFEVHTPAADIDVTGTCFSVQLAPQTSMPRDTRSLALGAAVAVAATVTVYEGSTVLANDHGSVELEAGQRGRAIEGQPPTTTVVPAEAASSLLASPTAELRTLRAENRRQAAEIDRLRSRSTASAGEDTAEPSGDGSEPTERSRFSGWGPPIPDGFDHYQPSDEALLEMAECGIVAWDQPPVWADDEQPDPQYLDALKLTDEERTAFVQAFDEFQADTVAQARSFYIELGGDAAVAEAIDPSELVGMVYGRTDLDSREDSRIALAMERAGLAQPPTDERPTSERLLRWDADLGNAFERSLAERLGPERAKALRDARGGWPGKRTTWADLCSERK
jgi:hypothetical protein